MEGVTIIEEQLGEDNGQQIIGTPLTAADMVIEANCDQRIFYS